MFNKNYANTRENLNPKHKKKEKIVPVEEEEEACLIGSLEKRSRENYE
jgi:hypothetical protein